MCINRRGILLFLIVSSLLLTAPAVYQKADGPIALRDEKLNFTPHEFYIADVTDDRSDKDPVASLVYKDEAHGYVSRSSDLKGGAALAIKLFIASNLQQNEKLRPVIISIKSLKLTETSQPGGRVAGHLSFNLVFGLQKAYGMQHLTEYTAGVRYTRPDDKYDMAEPTLRQAIEQALVWFNKWMNNNAESDARLAKSVKVKFSDYSEKPEGDTIYYSTSRPLTWKDFKEKPNMGNFDAEIFTSIGYTENASIDNGVIGLDIVMKVYLPKSDCWVRDRGLDDYALDHEQRHFDIAKIVAERFKRKISSINLPPDNYDGDINVEYLETLRELHRMQVQYDKETRHGSDRYGQRQWDEKIDSELKVLGVKINRQ
ncbi:MAG: DUF922 domain-containing protein [Mucilaginibacter sp.]